jgi:maltooligosyltrehalose trehalohydrolase
MSSYPKEPGLGASLLAGDCCRFLVYAPLARKVEVRLLSPRDRLVELERIEGGYHHGLVEDASPGALYLYRLDGSRELPDPASRFQPQGVHGPSQVVDPAAFKWTDGEWTGIQLEKYILYELHVGTFTPEGTFDAVVPHLDTLAELGITALEIMPVAQFPGDRNWGYDGACPFAVQNSYGGPDGMKRLVDACHSRGMAAVLDVVYNHLGPEGNYLGAYGPYFTDRYRSPWGQAVNFDGPGSDEVRRFFLENALYWLTELHMDALRIDAIHGIFDFSAYPFLAELADMVKEHAARRGREFFLIPESDLNDAKVVAARTEGGYGLDAQWNDDFHHALHALLTGERDGYYLDFGLLGHLAKAHEEGFVYSGQHSPYRGRRHGNSSRRLHAKRFVVFSQNHDQVGNRFHGERLSRLVPFEALKLAAGVVLLSPFVPLLFMGEEYGETAPFLYFVSHSDEDLVEAVRKGRKGEFAAFLHEGEPPDPQDASAFQRSRLDHGLRETGRHRVLLELYRELIRVRKFHPALSCLSKEELEAIPLEKEKCLCVLRGSGADRAAAVYHFGDSVISAAVPLPAGRWVKILDSSDRRWGGQGSNATGTFLSRGAVAVSLCPWSFVLLGLARDGIP